MTWKDWTALLRRKLATLAILTAAALALLALLALALQLLLWILPQELASSLQSWAVSVFQDPQLLRESLGQGGARSYGLFLGLQCLQVLVAPIPGQLMGLAGGYVFGFWKGFGLTMAGLGLGSFLAMGLARLLGQGWVRRVVPQEVMAKFDGLVSGGGYGAFFMIYLLPAMPDDALCFLAGLTKLKLAPLLLVCLLGRGPGMAVLSLIGSGLVGGSATEKVLMALVVVSSVPLWLFWEIIAEKIHRILKPFCNLR